MAIEVEGRIHTVTEDDLWVLTRDDIRAMKAADSWVLFYDHDKSPRGTLRMVSRPKDDELFSGDLYRFRDVACQAVMHSHDWKAGESRVEYRRASAHIWNDEVRHTLARIARPGDEVHLEFHAGGARTPVHEDHGLVGDSCYLKLRRGFKPKYGKSGVWLTFLIEQQVGEDNTARMCQRY